MPSTKPLQTRAQQLKIEHTTYDQSHPSENITINTYYAPPPTPPPASQQSIPRHKPKTPTTTSPNREKSFFTQHLKAYLTSKTHAYYHKSTSSSSAASQSKKEAPKIILLYSTPTEPTPPSPFRDPPPDNEILAFLGIRNPEAEGRSRNARRGNEEAERMGREDLERRYTNFQPYDYEETDSERASTSSLTRSLDDNQSVLRNEKYEKDGLVKSARGDEKLLPPVPTRSTSSLKNRSGASPRIRPQSHKREISASRIASYMSSGTDLLHAKRKSLSNHLSAHVRESTLKATRTYNNYYAQASNASDSSIESFFCAGEGGGGDSESNSSGASVDRDRSTSPWNPKGELLTGSRTATKAEERKKETRAEKTCRLCHRVNTSKFGGICYYCQQEYTRPHKTHLQSQNPISQDSETGSEPENSDVEEMNTKNRALPPAPLRIRKTSPAPLPNPSVNGRVSPLPVPKNVHERDMSRGRGVGIKTPTLSSIQTNISTTSATARTTAQQDHIAHHLRSPTGIQVNKWPDSPTTSPITRKNENKVGKHSGIWSKFNTYGTIEQEHEYDASLVVRDNLFYDLYDEVLNDYGGVDSPVSSPQVTRAVNVKGLV